MSVELEPVLKDIEDKTEEFFTLHWNDDEDVPKWSEPWELDGTMENHDKQGCYVLLSDETVKYIGVAISRGSGKYEKHGLGARTNKYTRLSGEGKGKYKFKDEWTKEGVKVNSIATIGFHDRAYMAAALEVYLLNYFVTKCNKLKPGSK